MPTGNILNKNGRKNTGVESPVIETVSRDENLCQYFLYER